MQTIIVLHPEQEDLLVHQEKECQQLEIVEEQILVLKEQTIDQLITGEHQRQELICLLQEVHR